MKSMTKKNDEPVEKQVIKFEHAFPIACLHNNLSGATLTS